MSEQGSYQDIQSALEELDICILVNNQTYMVPFDLAVNELQQDQIEGCLA